MRPLQNVPFAHRPLGPALVGVAAVALLLLPGCADDDQPVASFARGADQASPQPLRRSTQPTEHVGLSGSIPIAADAPQTTLAPLFSGDDGVRLDFGAGLTLRSDPHPKTSQEVVFTVTMTADAEPTERVVARVPASKANGNVFVEAVRSAAAAGADMDATEPDEAEPARIELRAVSPNGGRVVLAFIDEPRAAPVLEVTAETPTTSLAPGRINTAAYEGAPYESIYGLVWFTVSRDNFDFFVNRAYGLSAGKAQNFKDFELVPHNWLRLTVTPELDDDRVDVGFEVVTVDGDRVPVSRAPASLVAGEQFMRTVFRMMDNMADQEAQKPGSSTPWKAPFYYDDPEGGGVVEVIAQGEAGVSKIAYAVESPLKELTDVDFVEYQGTVEVPDDWDAPDPTCAALGSEEAAVGKFKVTFKPSSTVANSESAEPLRGAVYGSVFRSEDVKITGPIDGAQSVASFNYPSVDVTDGASDEYTIDTQLPAGNYQVLGFMDTDNNADPANADPDEGDPVFIPIGGFEMTCAEQPIVAEFALLLPPGQ